MYIRRLRAQQFRCFEEYDMEPAPGLNLIIGDNASGKTSLLEAIFLIGRGQSFRPSGPRSAIRNDADVFTLYAQVENEQGHRHRLGVERTRSRITLSKDGEPSATRLDLINTLPLQLIDPNVHRLLEQGPRYRRHFLDWGVFHVEHSFFPAWRRYRRALRQRNRALKSRQSKADVVAWDAELVRNAQIIDAARRSYIDSLEQRLPQQARRLLGEQPVMLDYACGWRGDDGFGAALAASLEHDHRTGFTQQGPHRADLQVSAAGASARDWVSRGQQKVLTVALLLVQAEVLHRRRHVRPVLLIDDLAAELGSRYRQVLLDEIQRVGGQCFLTFLDPAMVSDDLANSARMFHVEHGRVRRR